LRNDEVRVFLALQKGQIFATLWYAGDLFQGVCRSEATRGFFRKVHDMNNLTRKHPIRNLLGGLELSLLFPM